MQWLRDFAAAHAGRKGDPQSYQSESTVHVDEFGDATIRIRVGDADGSGRPAIQIELEHDFGSCAVAMSDEECVLVFGALVRERRKLASWMRRRK